MSSIHPRKSMQANSIPIILALKFIQIGAMQIPNSTRTWQSLMQKLLQSDNKQHLKLINACDISMTV